MIRVNAVLGKELTTRMRGWRAAAIITGYLAFLAAVSLMVMSSLNAPQSYALAANMGKTLFTWLAGFQMALIIFVTPASTADAISGERQRQTLDLLLATRLSSPSIVLGKLMAGLAFDVLLILCSLPLFSLVFLFGGVSPDQFVSMFVVFLATTLLLGSMALFISTLTQRSGAAMIISMLCTLGLTVGLALLSAYLAATTASNAPAGGMPAMPVTAYFDPLLGFVAALPDSGGLAGSAHFTGGPLNLALWQDQVIADVILSALFILGSVRLLRPRWAPR
jgi:ABC-type transport system involved in multi-copper enzyme maturation permease subunit